MQVYAAGVCEGVGARVASALARTVLRRSHVTHIMRLERFLSHM